VDRHNRGGLLSSEIMVFIEEAEVIVPISRTRGPTATCIARAAVGEARS
jgi:hypothetical protein